MDPNQQMQYMGAVHGYSYITFNAVNRLEVHYFQLMCPCVVQLGQGVGSFDAGNVSNRTSEWVHKMQ